MGDGTEMRARVQSYFRQNYKMVTPQIVNYIGLQRTNPNRVEGGKALVYSLVIFSFIFIFGSSSLPPFTPSWYSLSS